MYNVSENLINDRQQMKLPGSQGRRMSIAIATAFGAAAVTENNEKFRKITFENSESDQLQSACRNHDAISVYLAKILLVQNGCKIAT